MYRLIKKRYILKSTSHVINRIVGQFEVRQVINFLRKKSANNFVNRDAGIRRWIVSLSGEPSFLRFSTFSSFARRKSVRSVYEIKKKEKRRYWSSSMMTASWIQTEGALHNFIHRKYFWTFRLKVFLFPSIYSFLYARICYFFYPP